MTVFRGASQMVQSSSQPRQAWMAECPSGRRSPHPPADACPGVPRFLRDIVTCLCAVVLVTGQLSAEDGAPVPSTTGPAPAASSRFIAQSHRTLHYHGHTIPDTVVWIEQRVHEAR